MKYSLKRNKERFIITITVVIFVFLFFACSVYAQSYHGPESVIYDTLNSHYLISNVLSGDILQLSEEGLLSYYDRSLPPKEQYDAYFIISKGTFVCWQIIRVYSRSLISN